MASGSSRFHWADYLIFAFSLLLSCAVGVYYGVMDRKRKHVNSEEFLMGGRKMAVLPVSLSLVVSYMSTLSFMGDPVEVYYQGSVYMYILLGYCLALLPVALWMAPIYHRLKLISCFQYLETRFNNKIRVVASIAYILSTLFYLAIVMYGPSLAISQVTGVPLWVSIVSVGFVCIFYTAIGGLKAVLWADTLQTSVMVAGLVAIIAQGCHVLGGPQRVWELATDRGRINFNKFNPSPLERATFWTYVVGGYFRIFNSYSSSQIFIQRYCSLRSPSDVRLAVLLNVPLVALFVILFSLIGLVMVAYFRDCDPLLSGEITQPDQLVPLLMMKLLGHIPGLPGLFVACLFSASLSTLSSGFAALSTLFLKDFIQPLYERHRGQTLSEARVIALAKALSVIVGLVTMGLAFTVVLAGQTTLFVYSQKVTGMLYGPMAGLFVIGLASHMVQTKSASIGFAVGVIIPLSLGISSWIQPPPADSLEITSRGCLTENTTTLNHTSPFDAPLSTPSYLINVSDVTAVFDVTHVSDDRSQSPGLSPTLYAALGFFLTVVTSMIAAFIAHLWIGKRKKATNLEREKETEPDHTNCQSSSL